MSFELQLAEEKVKRHQVLGLHLMIGLSLLVAGALFLLMNYMVSKIGPNEKVSWGQMAPSKWIGVLLSVIGTLLLVITLGKHKWIYRKEVNRIVRSLELLVLLSVASFAGIKGQVAPAVMFGGLAAATLYAIFRESITDNTLYIHVNEQGIRLPVTAKKRFLAWWEIEQVLLKFGVLTIDCLDNRLFQWNIKHPPADTELFQSYCREHISTNKQKRGSNQW